MRRRLHNLRARFRPTPAVCGVAAVLCTVGAGVAIAWAGALRPAWVPAVIFLPAVTALLLALGVVGAAAIFISARLDRRRELPVRRVADALHAYADGERRNEALAIAATGEEAELIEAWNGILQDRAARREADYAASVAEAGGAGSSEAAAASSAIGALPHGVVLVDDRMVVVLANRVAFRLLGGEGESVAGTMLSEFPAASEIAPKVRAIIAGEHRTTSFDFTPGEDTSAGVHRVTIRAFRRASDAASAMILFEDVTRQRLAEESRGMFVAHAAHELRAPLTNIQLYVEEAIEEGDQDPALRAQALGVIQTEARRLERVVSDMLGVSEIESGTLSLRAGEVKLDRMFAELRTDFAAHAKEKEIELSFDLPPKFPVARADREKLAGALHNVIGNALKYTPPGGRVSVEVEADESELVVAVRDTGVGIAPEEQEKVFDRFYRAEGEQVRAQTGTGLGLPLAREIARLHGGDLTLESEPGAGSVFTLRVPVGGAGMRAAA